MPFPTVPQPTRHPTRPPDRAPGPFRLVAIGPLRLAILIVIAAMLVPHGAAVAQGKREIFPDPITTTQLGRLFERHGESIRLRREQWPTALAALDEYHIASSFGKA